MNSQTLHTKYLQEGTAGYAIIRKFYGRYSDVLAATNLIEVNDVVHEIFLSLSKTNFEDIQNIEHYTHRAIKLQCWSLLDKAIRQKAVISIANNSDEFETERNNKEVQANTQYNGQLSELEGAELLVQINLFKNRLKENDVRLLNFLIDETERSEIAKNLRINLNTLDTNIRRLRMKLADYLNRLGYIHKGLSRFS